jgi:hypothetical protein
MSTGARRLSVAQMCVCVCVCEREREREREHEHWLKKPLRRLGVAQANNILKRPLYIEFYVANVLGH